MSNQPTGADGRDEALIFGRYRFEPQRSRLTRGGVPVPLGSRALDILAALTERPGEVVSKEELMARAWPQLSVDEANLRVQISALRRALGPTESGRDHVATVPGLGYTFAAHVTRAPTREAPVHRRPLPATPRIVGRAQLVRTLTTLLGDTRLLTVTGAGGIGKTTVALFVATAAGSRFRDGAVAVDLAEGGDPGVALAAALGLAVAAREATARLGTYLARSEMLIVLDGCESVIEPAAALAEDILRAAPGVTILATSREPLGAEGERVWPLGPLAIPPPETASSAEAALKVPSVALFVQRAATARGFTLTDKDAPLVAAICRRLEGIPLAIELAAGRVQSFGLTGVAEALENRLDLLTQDRPTASPRHRTMAAAIDWTFEGLSTNEQILLRRVGRLIGPFSAAAAAEVAGDANLLPQEVPHALLGLVSKSLVATEVGREPPEYRLLEVTRDYALQRLRAAGEEDAAALRHAVHFAHVLKGAEGELDSLSKADWIGHYNRALANARIALDWSFGPNGDTDLAIDLTLAAAPVWFRLSQMDECVRRVETALAVARPESAEAMSLNAHLGSALLFEPGAVERSRRAWREAAALAERLGDAETRLRAAWGVWNANAYHGQMQTALEDARAFERLAVELGGPFERAAADRVLGVSLVLTGDYEGAREVIERVLRADVPTGLRTPIAWYSFDPRVVAHNTLAAIHWLQGRPDQAMAVATETVAFAQESEHDITLGAVLSDSACIIAFLVGDIAAAEHYLELLRLSTQRGALALYDLWVEVFAALLSARRGDAAAGLAVLRPGLLDSTTHPRFVLPLTQLALHLGACGAREAARRLADDLLARMETNGQRWVWPEIQRVRGELCADADAAEALFLAAIEASQAQGAPAWGLRAATSLARRRPEEAERIIAPWLAAFTEGWDTVDVMSARAAAQGEGPEPKQFVSTPGGRPARS